jgi:hypothetical protein
MVLIHTGRRLVVDWFWSGAGLRRWRSTVGRDAVLGEISPYGRGGTLGMVLNSARMRISVGPSVDVGIGTGYDPRPKDGYVWDGGGNL